MYGSLLMFESQRVARSLRHRSFWAGAAVLLWIAMTINYAATTSPGDRAGGVAAFAHSYFLVFAWIQILAVAVLTPAYIAGLIAHLQEQKALDVLFVSELFSNEIVTGIVLPRLWSIVYLLIAGLPVLMLSTILGGVVPGYVAMVYALAGSLMLGLAGVSVLCSVITRRAKDAILLAYTLQVLAFAVPLVLRPMLAAKTATGGWLSWIVVQHPLVVLGQLTSDKLDAFLSLAGPTMAAYVVVGVTAYVFASGIVRPLYLRRRFGVTVQRQRFHKRPPLGDHNPVLWRERYQGSGANLTTAGGLLLTLLSLVALGHCTIGAIHHCNLDEALRPQHDRTLAGVLTSYTVGLGCLHLLVVVARAASSIPAERENATLDTLAMTPLQSKEIAQGKIKAAIFASPWLVLTMTGCWLAMAVAKPVIVLFFPLLVLKLAIFSLAAAQIGYLAGANSASTGKAIVRAITIVLFANLLLPLCCCWPIGISVSPVVALASVPLAAFGPSAFGFPYSRGGFPVVLVFTALIWIPALFAFDASSHNTFDNHVRLETERTELRHRGRFGRRPPE